MQGPFNVDFNVYGQEKEDQDKRSNEEPMEGLSLEEESEYAEIFMLLNAEQFLDPLMQGELNLTEPTEEVVADDQYANHRNSANLKMKGDLEVYKSKDDQDYDPFKDVDVEFVVEQANKKDNNMVSEDEKEDKKLMKKR